MSEVSVEGVRDQYADGRIAEVWEIFIGDINARSKNYKQFLVDLLRKKGCRRILDAACGNGIDSIMLLEEDFEVVSCDASDKMLEYALKTRWERRKEPAFDNWVIKKANWVTLYDDLDQLVEDGFDAILCLGNSFAHLLDSCGDQREQRQAIQNFEKCLRPGGLLLIDHRNYGNIMETGKAPTKSVYYNCTHKMDIRTSVSYHYGKPSLIILDYILDTSGLLGDEDELVKGDCVSEFRLFYYPHEPEDFRRMLQEGFGENSHYEIFGDFKPLRNGEEPKYFIHLVQKSK